MKQEIKQQESQNLRENVKKAKFIPQDKLESAPEQYFLTGMPQNADCQTNEQLLGH